MKNIIWEIVDVIMHTIVFGLWFVLPPILIALLFVPGAGGR